MRGGRFTKVCSEAAICLNFEKVVPHCAEVIGLCGSGGGAMTFGISPHRLGRILPGGVEMKRSKSTCGSPVCWGYQPKGGYRLVARGE